MHSKQIVHARALRSRLHFNRISHYQVLSAFSNPRIWCNCCAVLVRASVCVHPLVVWNDRSKVVIVVSHGATSGSPIQGEQCTNPQSHSQVVNNLVRKTATAVATVTATATRPIALGVRSCVQSYVNLIRMRLTKTRIKHSSSRWH